MKRVFALLIALSLLLTGCGGDEPATSTPETTGTTTTTTTAAPTTTTAPAPVRYTNPLTGRQDMVTQNNRPVGYVITDEDSKHIQLNLEHADMYFESETEGGIPRILAIFSSVDRIPDEIGPVRSARPHFVKFADAIDAIYCHIGGSRTGLDTIKALGVDDVVNAEKINDILKKSQNRSWNRKTFPATKVKSEIKRLGHSVTTTTRAPFLFGSKAGSTPATTVVVRISNLYDMAFTYNKESGLYQKHRNSLNTPIHTTYTGGTIEVANLVVLYDHRFQDPKDANRVDFTMESGEGLIASGGTSRPMRWKRDSAGLHYYESDGVTPLTVAVGKTYTCLVSDTLKNRTKVQ